MSNPDVVIIGAGLAGLRCALDLQRAGLDVTVLEAADQVGGRIRTDEVDGFRLDRGFQVLLTAYPEAVAALDYDHLDLRPFYPGALVHFDGAFHRVADPFRRPLDGVKTLLGPIGSVTDKLRVAALRHHLLNRSVDEILTGPETTTAEALQHLGFSPAMIERFFRPFLGGVFLDPTLETTSRLFDFVFKMFATGSTALPAHGMQAIPEHLAARLAPGTVRLNTQVTAIHDGQVHLADGETLAPATIVLACDAGNARRLQPDLPTTAFHGTTCLYFAATEPPISEPVLMLNGDGHGRINSVVVPSQVSPAYAPPGQALISVSLIGVPDEPDADVLASVQRELETWFGEPVRNWRHLRTYRIPQALPVQRPGDPTTATPNAGRTGKVVLCGDYRDTASINGALASGRRAAETVLAKALAKAR